ncbi:hypothetical protein [Vreelandella zhaodongensis]|uniref:Uncharacterized protein n=1 Tax=Vreelandella zhaodongensis TaxID=1176240 RepID=A0ABX2ST86_VREZH|nr:hypothetical protein [Halomonas zhaodongensis]NYS45229.1 hypothetical protein [Halomonas zhaodongensis]
MNDALSRLAEIIAELLKLLVMVLLIQIVFFNLGRLSLWFLTIGRYPRGALTQRDVNWVTIFGFITFVMFVLAMGFYNASFGAHSMT